MSLYQLKTFQETAVNTLLDKVFYSKKETIVFTAPTGAGKTVMLIELMDRIVELNPETKDYAFIWLTPGNGELEEQSWSKAAENFVFTEAQKLDTALTSGLTVNSATFINWELVKSEKNVANREGEVKNLDDILSEARDKGVEFILIIDEEHRDQTEKAINIIKRIGAKKIIRVSATPTTDGDVEKAIVNEADVVAQGMITRDVVLNPDFEEGKVIAELREYFLEEADKKRREIKSAYEALDKKINPLVLIQFPDEKKINSKSKDIDIQYMAERDNLIQVVEKFLIEELGQNMETQVARWLSGDHFNTTDIEKNDSPVNYLLMKQAISTGWDAPRAKILVKLRLNTAPTFTLQTIGRIRRMPEQLHYDNSILNQAYIYSDDKKYVNEVLQTGGAIQVANFHLRDRIPDFKLVSIKPDEAFRSDNPDIAKRFRQQLVASLGLTDSTKNNRERFKNAGYIFGDHITSALKSGRLATGELDLERELDERTYDLPIDTNKHGLRLNDANRRIQKHLRTKTDRDTKAVLKELFSLIASGNPNIKKLLDLKTREFWTFIINNADKLRDEAKKMATGENAKQLDLWSNQLRQQKFEFPAQEQYAISSDDSNFKILTKNIYTGYSTRNWIKNSTPEIKFEKWIDSFEKTAYWYRGKDRGNQYFSIAYGDKSEGFFPDYLVMDVKGNVYIIETKGGQDANIDAYSKEKFKALKEYVAGDKIKRTLKFAFVRPDGDRLLFNNTEWDDDLHKTSVWRPIEELFNS